MKLEQPFYSLQERNPYWSSYTCLANAVIGKKYLKTEIRLAFRKAARGCQRSAGVLAVHHEAAPSTGGSDSHAAGGTDARSHEICGGIGRGERRLHPGRRARRQARRAVARDRQRSIFMRAGL